jgi:hypothetical protein
VAVYAAKRAGRNRVVVATPDKIDDADTVAVVGAAAAT